MKHAQRYLRCNEDRHFTKIIWKFMANVLQRHVPANVRISWDARDWTWRYHRDVIVVSSFECISMETPNDEVFATSAFWCITMTTPLWHHPIATLPRHHIDASPRWRHYFDALPVSYHTGNLWFITHMADIIMIYTNSTVMKNKHGTMKKYIANYVSGTLLYLCNVWLALL